MAVFDNDFDGRVVYNGSYRLTTNNRMELYAVINGLEEMKKTPIYGAKIVVHSDSRYVTEPINQGWIKNWNEKGWKKVANVDLWKGLLSLIDQIESDFGAKVVFEWIEGHAGHAFNEEADKLVKSAIELIPPKGDEGYLDRNIKRR